MDSPFTVAKDHMGFSHDYQSYTELAAHAEDGDLKLYFDFGSPDKNTGMAKPTIARFRFNLGGCRNRRELLTTLLRVYSGEYQYCGSSIQFNKQGNKVMLNLSMEIPVRENILNPDTIVDVDLGVDIPAICTMENGGATLDIGSKEDLLRIRTQLQNQRSSIQSNLVIAKGGHGRKKKLKKLDTLKAREANFANTYLHMVSKKAVEFAVDNHAGCIRLKNLEEYDSKDYLLKNMSYYKLCQQIEYKAAMQGVAVVYA
jgi:IS605 OrfB family transposase